MSALAVSRGQVQILRMPGSAKLAIVAACAGDPARASMLQLLVDGRAFTAGELSSVAGVTPQTASGHLSRMVDAGLMTVASQGRHRYYRLSSPQVAQMLEGMMVVAARTPDGAVRRRSDADCAQLLRSSRRQLGVGIAERLVDAGHLMLTEHGGEVTRSGTMFFRRVGIDAETAPSHRAFCRLPRLERAALSSRRHARHRIMHFCFDEGWIRHKPKKPRGRRSRRSACGNFARLFGLRLDR